MAKSKKKERRNVRISISASHRMERLLEQLGASCGFVRPSVMLYQLGLYCLENDWVVKEIQRQHNRDPQYRINGYRLNAQGHIEYIVGVEPEERYIFKEGSLGLMQKYVLDPFDVETEGWSIAPIQKETQPKSLPPK